MATNTEPTPVNAGYDLERSLPCPLALVPHAGQAQDATYLVPCRTVIARDLGFDDYRRVQLVGDEEVRGLIVTWDALCPPRLPEGDARTSETILDGTLHYITHQFGDCVPVTGEGMTEIAFVQEQSIGDVLRRDVLERN